MLFLIFLLQVFHYQLQEQDYWHSLQAKKYKSDLLFPSFTSFSSFIPDFLIFSMSFLLIPGAGRGGQTTSALLGHLNCTKFRWGTWSWKPTQILWDLLKSALERDRENSMDKEWKLWDWGRKTPREIRNSSLDEREGWNVTFPGKTRSFQHVEKPSDKKMPLLKLSASRLQGEGKKMSHRWKAKLQNTNPNSLLSEMPK